MSKYIPDFLKSKPVDMMGDYTNAYKVKTRFAMLGPVSAGKSTIAAGFNLTCETLSSLVPNFYCRCLPTSTHIMADSNNLRLGRFPEKTNPLLPRAPEAGFLLCERGWREKKVQVPLCDVAGEITDYINYRAQGTTPAQVIRQRLEMINRAVIETVKDSQGFIIALASTDALMFRENASTFDSDVYVHSVMNEILEYRRKNHKSDPNIIVVLTKWDEVAAQAQDIGMDIFGPSEDGIAKFMANGFPGTSMLLKPLKDKGLVKFFRSWFSIKRRQDGSKEFWPGTEQPVIEIIEDADAFIRFRPKYAEQDYIEMVKHIGSVGQ